ncbi:MAG: hypothetical protein HFI81_03395 [Eubacterium sp.]|nr:hypothetical protein [Eubacterium sp.]
MNQVTQAEAFGSYMQAAQQTSSEKADTKKNKVSGATIGDPKLSEKAAKYYEKLKKKYSNMDFILVSEDKKAEAQANAGKYANANRMVVLIDTEKIERMAEDNKYRKQYEAIISGATNQLSQLKSSLGANASSVKTYGMQVKEGTASFFAVVDKSLAAQKKRIEKKASQKQEEKKAAKKAAEEKAAEKKKAEKETYEAEFEQDWNEEDTITVTASSIEELMKKINDAIYLGRSDYVRTEQETWVGGHLDFYG